MDKKIKAFFAAMGIATALLVPVSASADNSDSKVQVSIDITWDSLEFTYTDGQWDPETHSYKGGGWSDSGGNFTVKNNGNVCVEAKFSYANATGMEEIKGRFSSSELIVPISESRNSKLTLSGKPTEHFESMTVGTITVNVTTDDSGDAGDSTITGWYKDEETGDWYYYDKNGKLVTGWFKDGGNEWYYADEDGNISIQKEHYNLEMLTVAQAVRACGGKVFVEVERIVEKGTIPPKSVKVPGLYIDYIVVMDEKDIPNKVVAVGGPYNPCMSGELKMPMGNSGSQPLPFDGIKVICRRAAMEFKAGIKANLGLGMPQSVGNIMEIGRAHV